MNQIAKFELYVSPEK